MIVDADVWFWTKTGMTQSPLTRVGGFIRKEEVEKLLADAHEKGRQHGLRQSIEVGNRAFEKAMAKTR